jgi:hypothetical protein
LLALNWGVFVPPVLKQINDLTAKGWCASTILILFICSPLNFNSKSNDTILQNKNYTNSIPFFTGQYNGYTATFKTAATKNINIEISWMVNLLILYLVNQLVCKYIFKQI